MTKESLEITKEVAKIVAKDIYDDGLKGSVIQTGQIIESIVGLFNNIVFYPVKKANVLFKYKLEDFKQDLEKKLSSIPTNKLVEPDLMIAGTTLEALKYTYDKQELRNMYLNLLASSMNKDTKEKTHPSYVEIIRQLTPLDARVFKRLSEMHQAACVHIKLKINNTTKFYGYAYPDYFIKELLDLGNEFDLSTSISNLIRLGLIRCENSELAGYDYESFKNLNIIVNKKKKIDEKNKSRGAGIATNIEIINQAIIQNDFGKRFAETCF